MGVQQLPHTLFRASPARERRLHPRSPREPRSQTALFGQILGRKLNKQETFMTVTEYLQGDHRRLDAILADVEKLIGAGSFDEARKRFAEFNAGLSRHID